jgi:hypothetical protein
MAKQHVGLNNGVVQMKRLLVMESTYVALAGWAAAVVFVFAPTAANPATIVEPYTVPLPVAAVLPPLILQTTNFQQFDPGLGTLNDVEIMLTGPFRWIPNQPGNTLSLEQVLRF